jgi:hypothetical protein
VETKSAWFSKLNWLGLLTVGIGIIQLIADSDITPVDVDKFLLILIGSLTIILRTFFTVGPVTMDPSKITPVLLALLIGLSGSSAFAQQQSTTLDATGVAAGSKFILTVNADGSMTVVPTQVLRLANLPNPGPSPLPQPGPLSPTVSLSKMLAEQALAKPGATKQTGAGLSAVYSAVSREINTGGLDPKSATAAIALGVNEVYRRATAEDKAAWTAYSTSISRALTEASINGDLATTGKWVVILDDFHKGIDLATGFVVEVTSLSTTDSNKAGILDGIDLTQLIELIKLILEILKAFKGL